MGAGPPVADSDHGATEIQKNFAARTRLTVGVVATAVAVAIAALLTAGDFGFPLATVGAWFAVVVMVVGLLQGRGLFFPTGLVVLGSVGVLELLHGTVATVEAPLLGGLLLAAAELGYWSFELQATVRQGEPVLRRRAGVIVGLVVAGSALSGAATGLVQVLR